MAADNDREDVVAVLLEAHADVNAQDSDGRTPFHNAVTNPDIVRALLAAGASGKVADGGGETPRSLAGNQAAAATGRRQREGAAEVCVILDSLETAREPTGDPLVTVRPSLCAAVLWLLRCPKCAGEYRVGEDATIVAMGDVFASTDTAMPNTQRFVNHPALVDQPAKGLVDQPAKGMDADGRRNALQQVERIQKAIREGIRLSWYCMACKNSDDSCSFPSDF